MSDIKKDLIKYTPREEQQRVHDFIFKLKKEKPEIKFFLLNLPTGVGKSHLAMMIANEYISKINNSAKCDIITASKILQDQYADSYDSITDLKGKENYKCHQYSCSCAQGMEFNKLNKTSCDFCPYESAKQSYLGGKVSLTNFYLYLIYAIYNPKMFESRGDKVLIVDECLHPDTEITLHDGGKKKIKDIIEGDLVLTVNEESGEIEIKPVIKLHTNLNKGTQMYEIEMENGDILNITGNHKVKLIDGSWKKVEDLKECDEILYINEIESHDYDD
jgi:Rad3-related DNA helicase